MIIFKSLVSKIEIFAGVTLVCFWLSNFEIQSVANTPHLILSSCNYLFPCIIAVSNLLGNFAAGKRYGTACI